MTRGRIAWNAVTSAYKNEAANYGFEVMMDHDVRYLRAQEFLEVACKLWDSVEKDALIADREKGIFADPAKVRRIDHRGRYFNVRGPLPALPSPQQRPVIIQAGLSGPGMDLAAAYADMQFSTRRTVTSMKQHRQALDAKLASLNRQVIRHSSAPHIPNVLLPIATTANAGLIAAKPTRRALGRGRLSAKMGPPTPAESRWCAGAAWS